MPARSTVTCRPFGATTVAVCSSSGAACLTPGSRFARARAGFVEALAAARAQLQLRGADDGVGTTSRVEPAMLALGDVAANTSATAIAIPAPASSSCAACTRSRRR